MGAFKEGDLFDSQILDWDIDSELLIDPFTRESRALCVTIPTKNTVHKK